VLTAELHVGNSRIVIFRTLLVAAVALLLAAQVVRNAGVRAFAGTAPAAAARLWPTHPDVQLTQGMTEIAIAARQGRPVPPTLLAQLYAVSRAEPLSPQPFLVRGVQAQLSGNQSLAEQAFLAAKWRDARSLPARYFLADLYFRRGDADRGLPELGALARLAPNGALKLAPFVAVYARNPRNWRQVRALFSAEPYLAENTLAQLAAVPANTATVLALADPQQVRPNAPWVAALVTNLAKAGEYAKARQVWAKFSRVEERQSGFVFDSRFTRGDAPPPFNWALTSSTVGLAERQRGGGLHVIYYGQEDGVLASQLLLLQPGRYRLSFELSGAAEARSLRWNLLCDKGNATIASVPIARAATQVFEVPASCPAQRLELSGSSSDVPRQTELTVRSVTLAPERPNG
jgi:hypothetical protein